MQQRLHRENAEKKDLSQEEDNKEFQKGFQNKEKLLIGRNYWKTNWESQNQGENRGDQRQSDFHKFKSMKSFKEDQKA